MGRLAVRAALLAACVALAGCGFRMMGAPASQAPGLSRVYIDYSTGYTVARPHLLNALRRDLQARGTKVVDQPDENTAVLKVSSVGASERISAVGTSGYAEQYELTEHVHFSLSRGGKRLVGPATLSRSADYAYSASTRLATEQQRQRLERQLQGDLAAAMLRHIDTVLAGKPGAHGSAAGPNKT